MNYKLNEIFYFETNQAKIEIEIKVNQRNEISFYGNIDSNFIKGEGNVLNEVKILSQNTKDESLKLILKLWEKYLSTKTHIGTPNQEAYISNSGYQNSLLEIGMNKELLKRLGVPPEKYNDKIVFYGDDVVHWTIEEKELDLLNKISKNKIQKVS